MKNRWRHLVAGYILLLLSLATAAQDSARFRQDRFPGRSDSARQQSDTNRPRRGGMSSLFADSAKLTSSDYQLQIEKTYVILDNIENKSELGFAIKEIKENMADNDSVLA